MTGHYCNLVSCLIVSRSPQKRNSLAKHVRISRGLAKVLAMLLGQIAQNFPATPLRWASVEKATGKKSYYVLGHSA